MVSNVTNCRRDLYWCSTPHLCIQFGLGGSQEAASATQGSATVAGMGVRFLWRWRFAPARHSRRSFRHFEFDAATTRSRAPRTASLHSLISISFRSPMGVSMTIPGWKRYSSQPCCPMGLKSNKPSSSWSVTADLCPDTTSGVAACRQ